MICSSESCNCFSLGSWEILFWASEKMRLSAGNKVVSIPWNHLVTFHTFSQLPLCKVPKISDFFKCVPQLSRELGWLLRKYRGNSPKSWDLPFPASILLVCYGMFACKFSLFKFNQVHSLWPLANSSQIEDLWHCLAGLEWRLNHLLLPNKLKS